MRQDLQEMGTSPKAGLDGIISFLSAIVDSSDDAIVSKTLDGTIMSWNPAAERMFGYSAAEAIGRHITLIIPPERHAEEAEVLARIRRGEKVDHFETVRQAKDGRKVLISLTVSPIRDGNGNIIGASKVARDITDRKRAEREELLAREETVREAQHVNRLLNEQVEALRQEVIAREKAQADLVEALKSRDEFIAVAAHELRNPLNVILLTGQLLDQALADPAGLPKVRVLVEKLRVQRRRLNALVERLFDVSRIRAGKFELLKERFDLCGLIREVVARFLDQFSSIRICLDERMVIEGSWDRVRIDQALTNLVSNAIKYGRQKPITISAFVQDHHAVIRVEDQGIGISHQDCERVFDRFEQGGAVSGNKGLGLGLWITKTIVEAHGGTVAAESELGKGSAFTIKIPQERDYGTGRKA